MKSLKKILAALSISLPLSLGACGAPLEPAEGEPAVEAEEAPLAEAPAFEGDPPGGETAEPWREAEAGCGCGRFLDDDLDGVCDLAASGECRKARTGRCPCGGGCEGC